MEVLTKAERCVNERRGREQKLRFEKRQDCETKEPRSQSLLKPSWSTPTLDMNYSLSNRREPIDEGKGFRSVPSNPIISFSCLEESEVDPRDQPAELNENERGSISQNAYYVGKGHVEHR